MAQFLNLCHGADSRVTKVNGPTVSKEGMNFRNHALIIASFRVCPFQTSPLEFERLFLIRTLTPQNVTTQDTLPSVAQLPAQAIVPTKLPNQAQNVRTEFEQSSNLATIFSNHRTTQRKAHRDGLESRRSGISFGQRHPL
jgi:hypothetical protein